MSSPPPTNSKSSSIKRPLNSFMLYRRDRQLEIPTTNHQSISRIIGELWRNESAQVKRYYAELSALERQKHMLQNPEYKYTPKKRACRRSKRKPSSTRSRPQTDLSILQQISTYSASSEHTASVLSRVNESRLAAGTVDKNIPVDLAQQVYKLADYNINVHAADDSDNASTSTLSSPMVRNLSLPSSLPTASSSIVQNSAEPLQDTLTFHRHPFPLARTKSLFQPPTEAWFPNVAPPLKRSLSINDSKDASLLLSNSSDSIPDADDASRDFLASGDSYSMQHPRSENPACDQLVIESLQGARRPSMVDEVDSSPKTPPPTNLHEPRIETGSFETPSSIRNFGVSSVGTDNEDTYGTPYYTPGPNASRMNSGASGYFSSPTSRYSILDPFQTPQYDNVVREKSYLDVEPLMGDLFSTNTLDTQELNDLFTQIPNHNSTQETRDEFSDLTPSLLEPWLPSGK
ncbi:transcription factor Ste11 [Schizosaccharomyces cryophilus OY26]|uniref:Transcription factor Ste11 n=1 Tax=Schizosaccharomyces cryophilus (strain OY26 / ATCC MYA-4695 / CBS 11777 / NBRC 106824 / NRRL Y48691) TaxID=653667 RepID=S9XIX2_SCHCR|nr:transcription factor Ste11 [Schizosaccharomyces cryophilus OY26]EPY53576.1 transcription factor Ste11 [Schizosaccharomyces cryophilus OY26]